MAQRIGEVRVSPHLEDDRLGLEPFYGRQDPAPKCIQPYIAGRISIQRNVESGELSPCLVRETRSWKQGSAALVNAAGEDGRFVVPDPLDAISVMEIDVYVSNSIEAIPKERTCDGGIV